MNVTRKEVYLFVALIVGAIVLHAYIGTVRDVSKAEKVKADVAEQLKALQGGLKSQLDALDGKIQAAKTPQAQAQVIREYLPYAQPVTNAPQVNQTPAVAIPASGHVSDLPLPDAPSALIITPDKFPELLKDIQACKASDLKLKECQQEVPLITQERDAWKKAAKGGGFWSRAKKAAIWGGIGFGAGYVLSRR